MSAFNDKALELRQMLRGDRPVLMVGAHDPLTARLVEEAGFDTVWASGFEISTSRGVPDASLLTMTELLDAARHMNGAVSLPIVADCDSGFGNAVNAIHMIHAYEQAGIAAVCIEDSAFPKRCSFYADTRRELTSVDEQALKIQAVCDARASATVVIARTEALVANLGLNEALARGRAYADAGADCVLVHSRQETAQEVLAFAHAWQSDVPLVAVPTTYAGVHVDELWAAGFRAVIFANQGIRSEIRAIRDTLLQLKSAGYAAAVDHRIAPLSDVFDLVRLDDLRIAERRYLTGGEIVR